MVREPLSRARGDCPRDRLDRVAARSTSAGLTPIILVTDEVRNPQRDIPIALILPVVLSTIIYLLRGRTRIAGTD